MDSTSLTTDRIDRSKAPAVHPLPTLELPEWEERRLACGARLVTLRAASCDPQVFQLKATVAGAGEFDLPGSVVTRLLPLVIDQGAGGRDADAVAETFEGNGAWLRRKLHTRHIELSVQGLNDTAGVVVPAFLDVLARPAFDAGRMAAIASMKAQELSVSLGKPMTLARREMARRFWGEGHPGAFAPAPDDFLAAGRDAIAAFHAATFRPPAMTFYLSGRIDDALESLVADAIAAALAPLADGSGHRLAPVAAPSPAPGRYRLTLDGSTQDALLIGVPAILRSHPDYEMLRLAVTGLGGYFGSRLTANLREERGLTYGIGSSLAATREGSMMEIATQCRLDMADEAIGEIRREIDRFITDPPRGEELRRLTAFALTRLTGIFDTPFNILDCAVTYQVVGTTRDYFARSVNALRRATPDELSRVMAEHLSGPAIEISVT